VAILVTRPEPDNATTAAALGARGFAVLRAPLLQFQPLPFRLQSDLQYRGVIVTSTNALRAIASHPLQRDLLELPLFAVGERTAETARANGFSNVVAADGDVAALRKLIVATARKNASAPLLYLAGAELASDLATDLASAKIAVTTLTVYRMAGIDDMPVDVSTAFANHAIEAVLHYSTRTAQAFVVGVRRAGLEIAGLGVLQLCMSDSVARVLRDAGAARVISADSAQEDAMFEALERALRPRKA
jgi:uroporphyrinogen-III synthase